MFLLFKTKIQYFKNAFLFLVPVLVCCNYAFYDPLTGVEKLNTGVFNDLEYGRLYLPEGWDENKKYPVTVILHGFGELSRSLSEKPVWKTTADESGIVLYFVETGHMGWYEKYDSKDTLIITNVLKSFRKKQWVRENGVQLFGWSAGAIMAMGMNAINKKQSDGNPLFDRLAVISGGFGIIMENELKKNPELKKSVRIPAFICWGDKEPDDHGIKASQYLNNLGWKVLTKTHPDGHILVNDLIKDALLINASE